MTLHPRGILVLIVAVLGAIWAFAAFRIRSGDPIVEVFDAGTIGTVNGLAFEADGRLAYATEFYERGDGESLSGIFTYRRDGGGWVQEGMLSLSEGYATYQPTLSPDGAHLFFVSRRPLPGTDEETRQNVWFVERRDGGWGEPQVVPELVSPHWDGHAMLTRSGRLYFASDRPGGAGGLDIYSCEFTEGHCREMTNVAALNGRDGENDLFVDPGERFIIFQRQMEGGDNLDLYVSLRRDGEWRAPRALSRINSSDAWEMSPTVSADCKWFYFHRAGTPGILRTELAGVLGFDPCQQGPLEPSGNDGSTRSED